MIDDVRLPEDIERGTVGGPGFKTTVITLASGTERRNSEWSLTRGRFNIGYGVQRREDMEAVYSFFHARHGRARGFRFRNWLDFRVKHEGVLEVDGQPLQRQLVRFYADPANPYTKPVILPVANTLEIFVNQVKVTTGWQLKPGGIVEFATDPGLDVLASFEFDIPVRFDLDNLNVQLNTYTEGSIPSIPVTELRL
jgi:uncharacterized protein (TIGR02217 family)